MSDLTILMPVRNGATYLGEALDSITAQTFADWKCIVLDDCSEDATGEILAAHAGRDPRFEVITGEAPLGVGRSGDLLLRRARTRWVARMDSDDVMRADRLERQIEAAAQDPSVALWGTLAHPLGDSSEGWRHYLDWANTLTSDSEIRLNGFTELPLPHPSWLADRETLLCAGGYRHGEFPEDYDLFLNLLNRGVKFGKVDLPLLGWRDHPARQTRTNPALKRDNFLRLKARHLAEALTNGSIHNTSPAGSVSIWGAGKTGRILQRELSASGLEPLRFVDPLKAGSVKCGLPVIAPEEYPPASGMLLVAVGPRPLRAELKERFDRAGMEFGRDYLWLF